MKKTLISLAVAAALVPAAAMADTSNVTVYGKVNVSYDRLDNDVETGGFVSSNSSRIGFKGTEDLGDGLKAVWQYETTVAADSNSGISTSSATCAPAATCATTATVSNSSSGLFGSARDTYLGVSGNFGTVTAGRQAWTNLFKDDANFFVDGIGGPANWLDAGKGRANNTIKYATPNMNGFDASITYVTPGGLAGNANSSLVDLNAWTATATAGESEQMSAGNTTESSYALRAAYNNGPLFAALTYLDEGSNAASPDTKATSIAASYVFGPGKVAAQWVKVKNTDNLTTDDDVRYWTIGGSYKVTANGTVKVNYTDADDWGNVANTGADMIAIGYDHALSKRTSVYATYARTSNDSAADYTMTGGGHGASTGAIAVGKDASGLSLGMVHDF